MDSYEIKQIVDEKGEKVGSVPKELTKKKLVDLYYQMVRLEYFSKKMVNLVKQGKVSSFASSLGQEATQVGMASPLEEKDWFVPAFREHGVAMIKGIPIKDVMLHWGGMEKGNYIPEGIRLLPVNVPIASQYCHAAGLALAAKIRGEDHVVEVVCGDGGVSEGDWHESLNFASIHDLPVVFVVQNNQWSISTPRHLQSKTETIAVKSVAYGIPGIRVDGNDVVAVYSVIKDAMNHARSGKGPILIESITYRMDDHTTADDAKRYRTEEELEFWRKKSPVLRMKLFLSKYHKWTEKNDKELVDKAYGEVDQAIEEYLKEEQETIEDAFIYHYKEMPWNLEEQLEELRQEVGQASGGAK